MFACREENKQFVELLLKNNASVNALDTYRAPTLFYVCRNTNENIEIVKLFVNNNADLKIKSKYFKNISAYLLPKITII